MHLALQACGISDGDEVLVPSITYVASFQAISATGASPVACDVELESLCLNWKDAEKRINSKTKAIMPVHYSGGVGNLDKIYELAKSHNLRVIEDAAHAFGTSYKQRRVGGFGDIACFSFDGIKNITSGEGGCIVTEDKQVLDSVKDTRLLGVEKDSEKRYRGQRSWNFNVRQQGWRYHMSDIMAAIGIQQLERFDSIALKRQAIASQYTKKLDGHKMLKMINHNYDHVVPHIFPIILCPDCCRDSISQKLNSKGIQTGIHYIPNHYHSFYENCGSKKQKLFITEKTCKSLLTLPLHEDLTECEIDYVVKCLKESLLD